MQVVLLAEEQTGNVSSAVRAMTRAALRDLKSLEEDASFKAQKIQFLLDATLGLINLAQNDIIKLFSVLAVIFMPPTDAKEKSARDSRVSARVSPHRYYNYYAGRHYGGYRGRHYGWYPRW